MTVYVTQEGITRVIGEPPPEAPPVVSDLEAADRVGKQAAKEARQRQWTGRQVKGKEVES